MTSLRITVAVAAVAVLLVGTGCSYHIDKVEQANLVENNYKAVDKMMDRICLSLRHDAPIVVATFVSNDDLTLTSPLGRVLGTMTADRLTQRGYKVVDPKVRADSMVIQPRGGEFVLSRDPAVLCQQYGAEYVLVGVYSRTDVREKIRSVNQKLEVLDPELMSNPMYSVQPRKFEKIDDTVYVSMRLIRAKDHVVVAAENFRLTVDENVDSLLMHGQEDTFPRL